MCESLSIVSPIVVAAAFSTSPSCRRSAQFKARNQNVMRENNCSQLKWEISLHNEEEE